ncbi:hypothetical protein F4801DRAFT_158887 [Xylaria longipes]|nr:hypothetical protein F4801DRAFT_158887 [Xylaria longipes]
MNVSPQRVDSRRLPRILDSELHAADIALQYRSANTQPCRIGANLPMLMSFLSNFQLTVHTVVHDAPRSKAAIYVVAQADLPVGPYSNEHALFLWFDDSGEKVKRIEEMFDETAMTDFMPKFQTFVAQHKPQS